LDRDIDQIKLWIIKKRLQGWVVTDICVSVRISRDMFYRWWNRYQNLGWVGRRKAERSSKDLEIDKVIKDCVVGLRTRYGGVRKDCRRSEA